MNLDHKPPKPQGPENRPAYCGYRQVTEAEKDKLVHHHFDAVARKYDFMNTLLSFGLHHLWKRAAVRRLDLPPGARVLDVCGGTADLALRAARIIGDSGRVVVYDFNWAMMAAGRRKAGRSPLAPRISYIQGDAQRLGCRDASFDAAMVGFGIRNLTHPEMGLAEMFRVLKPGGQMMCLEFSRPRTAWFRRLYDFYSFAVMPALGNILARSRDAYTYLPESIRMFSQPEELAAVLTGIGFIRVKYRRLTDGIAVIHSGVKP